MAWSAKFLSVAELETLINDGTLREFFDESKAHIEEGKNYIAYSFDLTDDDKYDHWVNTFQAFVNQNIIEEGDHTYYVLAHSLDDKPKLIHAAWYDSTTNAINTAHSLNRFIDGSKSWAFDEACWIPAVNLAKNIGATKWNFHSTQGGSISFRIKTGRGAPNIFDYDSVVQEDINTTKTVAINNEPIPTIDGSVKESDNKTIDLNINEVVTTINFK